MIWDLLINSQLVQAIIALVVGFGGAAAWGWKKKREGAAAERRRAKEEDIKNAESLRERVARDLADELRKHEGRGYRDAE